MLRFECVQDEIGLAELKPVWDELWDQSINRSYFLTHDWFSCCWHELKSTNELRVFVGRDRGTTVLIAPCMRSRGVYKRLPVNYLTFISHPETQIADVIVSSAVDGRQALVEWMQHLLGSRSSEWNILSLDKIASDPQTSPWLGSTCEKFGHNSSLKSSHQALIIPLCGSWDDYLRGRSVRFRKTLRNITNRIQRLGSVEVKTFSGCVAAKQAIADLFAVSAASWKVSRGIAITSSLERMNFFQELLRSAATADAIRIIVLAVDGKAIASETQVVDNGTIYALRSDYDERSADSSPGTYLQMQILKESFGSVYKEYNFGVGLNPYKFRWTEQTTGLVNFRLYNGIYGQFLRLIDNYRTTSISQLLGRYAGNGLPSWKSS